jgi:hypothetical protein
MINLSGFIQKKISRLINRNYFLAERLRYMRFRKSDDRERTPLIIYQMGKVGSTTLLQSLQNTSLDMDVLHVHVLLPEWITKVRDQYRYTDILASIYLRERLDNEFDRHQWKVISLVRDPIARNISSFFQALPVNFPKLQKRYLQEGIELKDRVNELIEVFLERFDEHETPVRWFDVHMQPVFGLDVYKNGFTHSKGYQIYHHNKC